MTGTLETCECGKIFIRGIFPQKKCYICDALAWRKPVIVRYAGEEEPRMEVCEIEEKS